jgi:hypothetical protein
LLRSHCCARGVCGQFNLSQQSPVMCHLPWRVTNASSRLVGRRILQQRPRCVRIASLPRLRRSTRLSPCHLAMHCRCSTLSNRPQSSPIWLVLHGKLRLVRRFLHYPLFPLRLPQCEMLLIYI